MEENQIIEQPADEQSPQNENRFKRFARTATRYLGIALIVLALASLAVWLGFIRPLSMELEQANADLQAAQSTISELQIEVAGLSSVETDLLQARGQSDLLRILADVNAARFALAEDDLNGAQGALSEITAILTSLSANLGPAYSDQIADMRARLELANEEILGAEKFSAQSDLEVLANLILSLDAELLAE